MPSRQTLAVNTEPPERIPDSDIRGGVEALRRRDLKIHAAAARNVAYAELNLMS